jgi:GrpB-like predicted nucleotidyltransferase (UPF0157 family)
MIGLRRHTVRVVEHDPEWASRFEEEAATIRRVGGPLVLDVQHVGSTAVPGLPAKPILDIAVAVGSSGDIPELVRRLTAVGYIDRGDGGRDGGYLLVRDSEPEVRTAHVHIVERADPQWHRYVVFRDILRRDDAIRQQYGDMKKQLAAAYPTDRERYTTSKSEFIQRVRSAPNKKIGFGANGRQHPDNQGNSNA